MTKKRFGLVAGITVVTLGSIALGTQKPVCPDDYGTDDAGSAAYLTATDKWTNDFFDAHPEATMTDWAEARYEFWVDNHCTVALQRYEDVKAGKVDPETKRKVDKVIQDAMANPTP